MRKRDKIQRDKMKKYLFEILQSYHGTENIDALHGIILHEKIFGTYTPVVSDENILIYTIMDPSEVFYRGYKEIFSIVYSIGGKFEIVESYHNNCNTITNIIIKIKEEETR